MTKSMLLKKLFATLGAFLFCAPVFLLLGAGMRQDPAVWLVVLLLSLVLALLLRLLKKGRMPLCLLGMALVMAFGVWWGRRHGVMWISLVPSALGAALLPVHLLALCQRGGDEYPPSIWYLGVGVQVVSLVLLRIDTLFPASDWLRVVSPAYFVFVLFALNETTLEAGMAGDRRPSPLMRWRNRLRAAGLGALLLVLTHLDAIRRAFDGAVQLIKRVINWILSWLLREQAEELPPGEAAERLDLSGLAGENAEPALIWTILEHALRVAALIIAAIFLLFLLRQAARLLKTLFLYLREQLRAYAGRVNDAYEDTVESLLDWGEVKRTISQAREKIRVRRESRVPWERLSPREQVRRVYQLLRKKAGTVPNEKTARHLLLSGDLTVQGDTAREVADLYDAARYSSREITAEQAAQARKKTKL